MVRESAKPVAKTAAPKTRRATKSKAAAPVSAAPAPASPAQRETKPVRMVTPLGTASRMATIHPGVVAAKSVKPGAASRSLARR